MKSKTWRSLTALLAGQALALLAGCNSPQEAESPSASAPEPLLLAAAGSTAAAMPGLEQAAPAPAPSGPISQHQGFYVGMFIAEEQDYEKDPKYENKINFAIDSLEAGKVAGHSVVAGNLRPFAGQVKSLGAGKYELTASEPGDDKYDGVFHATLDTNEQTLSGTWVANDKDLPVTKRSYELTKTEFKYDPQQELGEVWDAVYGAYEGEYKAEAITEDAGKFNASVKALRSRDIENMYKRDLEVMRNAIYARHGYSFQNRQMRHFFDTCVDWYVPVSVDVTKQLTDIELKNIVLLKRYEKHAESYYDHFGR